MNLKVKSQKLRGFVRHKDDLIIECLFLTNSETGHKALRVEPRLFKVKCSNGMIVEEPKTRHRGKAWNTTRKECGATKISLKTGIAIKRNRLSDFQKTLLNQLDTEERH